MKNRKWVKWGIIFAVIVIIGSVLFYVDLSSLLTDVGNNNRYDSDYSSDSGGDGGLFDLIYMLIRIVIIVFDVFGFVPGMIVLCVGLFLIILVGKKQMKKHANKTILNDMSSSNNLNYTNNSLIVAEKIRQVDPDFSAYAFIGFVREVFVKIQEAWTTRDWKVIRPFESNELFSQHSMQLQEYINNNKINVIEKINITTCVLSDFRIDGDKEVVVVELHAVMRDYVIDATTRNVLESDPNKDWNMKYLMTFNRKVGVKTKEGVSDKVVTNCPNCGAPTTITSSGQCDYCESVITTGEHGWVLSDIRAI